jgi:DNA-binding NtrC family response regulator
MKINILLLDDDLSGSVAALYRALKQFVQDDYQIPSDFPNSISQIEFKTSWPYGVDCLIGLETNTATCKTPDKVMNWLSTRSEEYKNSVDLVMLDEDWGIGNNLAGHEKLLPLIYDEYTNAKICVFTQHWSNPSTIDAMVSKFSCYPYPVLSRIRGLSKDDIASIQILIAGLRGDKLTESFQGVARSAIKQETKMVFESQVMKDLMTVIETRAQDNDPICLVGETGVGKTLIARYIHLMSPRRNGNFAKYSCANITESIADSIIFGNVKGTFTGAETTTGWVQAAHKGTLFLDEVAEMDLKTQAKFLEVLEESTYEAVGGKKEKVDFRLISATNTMLDEAVTQGKFRNDLLMRLGIQIYIPSLRERKDDIIPLALHFFEEFRTERNMYGITNIAEDARSWLLNQISDLNIRQLRIYVRNAMMICKTGILRENHFKQILSHSVKPTISNTILTMPNVEFPCILPQLNDFVNAGVVVTNDLQYHILDCILEHSDKGIELEALFQCIINVNPGIFKLSTKDNSKNNIKSQINKIRDKLRKIMVHGQYHGITCRVYKIIVNKPS